MHTFRIQPLSLLAGAALTAVLGLCMAQQPPAPAGFEYSIHLDVDEDMLTELSADGWEFVGYLGQSRKGASSDETLWRKPE